MRQSVSDRARQLATELDRLFAQDTDLADKLNDAHRRLPDSNDRLRSGLHPDGLRAVYGDHLESEGMRLALVGRGASQVLDSSDALDAVQEARWEIHRAHCDYQEVAEARRRLAADIRDHPAVPRRTHGGRMVPAGGPQREHRRARLIGGSAAMIDPGNGLIEEILASSPDRNERFEPRPNDLEPGDPPFAEASARHEAKDAGSRLVDEGHLRSSGSIDPFGARRAL